jgi:hypothetical protein
MQKGLRNWAKQDQNNSKHKPSRSQTIANKAVTSTQNKIENGNPAGGHGGAKIEPQLAKLINRWPSLSELTRGAILILAKIPTQTEGTDSDDNPDISA